MQEIESLTDAMPTRCVHGRSVEEACSDCEAHNKAAKTLDAALLTLDPSQDGYWEVARERWAGMTNNEKAQLDSQVDEWFPRDTMRGIIMAHRQKEPGDVTVANFKLTWPKAAEEGE